MTGQRSNQPIADGLIRTPNFEIRDAGSTLMGTSRQLRAIARWNRGLRQSLRSFTLTSCSTATRSKLVLRSGENTRRSDRANGLGTPWDSLTCFALPLAASP